MFEKEAEEIEKEAVKWVKNAFPNDEFKQSGISRALVEFAELGYNKANEWHQQATDNIYDFIAKDWSLKYFICIMKDKSRVTATGICDEDYGGGVSTYLDFGHDDEKYSSEDIVWWKELELPKE